MEGGTILEGLTLQHRSGKGTNEQGKEFSYEQYFVKVQNVEIQLKPVDQTSKQILANYFGVTK